MDKTYCLRCGGPATVMTTEGGPRCRGCLGTEFYHGSEEAFLVFKAKSSMEDHRDLAKRAIGDNMRESVTTAYAALKAV